MTDPLAASKLNKDSTPLDPPAPIKQEQAPISTVTKTYFDTKEGKEPTPQMTCSPQEGELSTTETKEGEVSSEQHAPVTDLIVNDHNQVKSLYKDYKDCGDMEEKQKLRNRIVKALVMHDECEQMIVYPLLKERIPGDVGKQEYKRSLSEHQHLRDLLYELFYINMKEDPGFDTKMETAMEAVFHHIDTEEQKVLPMLKEHVEDKELREVGNTFKKQKNMTVTRAHPHAPQEGMSAKVANVIMSPFDKLEDLMSDT